MRVRIQHVTRYVYDQPVALGQHTIRLSPAPHLASRVLTYGLTITPEPRIHWQLDAWSNRIARCTWPEEATVRELVIQVDASFELKPVNPFDFTLDERCVEVPFAYPDGYDEELAPFLQAPRLEPEVETWLRDVPERGYVVDWLVALNAKVARDVGYVIRTEPGIQTPGETLRKARGSCRDSAWLLVHAARARGLAARFVSGYLIQLEDEGNIPGVARGMDRDVLDLHAWAEVYVPGAGWIGLDGTSGLFTTEGHIPLAATVTPALAAPLTGTATGPASAFDFSMTVERLGHEPRPRKPYTDEQYAALLEAADAVDARLDAAGVALTVGGEPTWTSREHPRDKAWMTEAVGETKWTQGLRMAAEIHRRMAPGGVVLHRFGKHYPGESLPRWALHVLWRKDGRPVWRDPALLALPGGLEGTAGLEEARTFVAALHGRLGLDMEPLEAFEDPWWAITREADLPEDVDPLTVDPDDGEERRRLARMLGHGLTRPVGFVTPLQLAQSRWVTQRWSFRRGRLILVPGDSPVGLRLPLDRLGGTPVGWWPQDPWATPTDLAFDPVVERRQEPGETWEAPSTGAPAVRTAITVEPRDGVLHVFLPPTPTTEAWLELVAAAEDAAREAGLPVRLEGYGPPSDPRLGDCLVTPDPGVLEINVPPVRTTRAYAEQLDVLGEAANHAGLTTERWQLDGRSVGSGGGNHVTLGGPTPAESVFLQRPAVLASLVRYVQHHPCLSYFFTGLFVGPTSQAPRLDEARDEIVDEVELALSQLQRGGEAPPPWFVDRLLRNLLVDLTGNTHRAELSIDKLYNPGSPTGRLGVVEFRAFEMPPNERMATAVVHLLRALILRFVEDPFTAPLVRWGRRLHDRFLLPTLLWDDLRDVLADLRAHGIAADEDWYAPYLEYRFPVMGRLLVDGVEVVVRPALEPWPVLGEEPTGATVSRFVDSSLERIEVTVRGLDDTRHALAVNGVLLPLHPTRDPDLAVAGVRFRAWQPVHCLQPHIGVHHPLRVDVVDTWARRSLGAATYHVWHPEGRAFDEPPITAFEASARRAGRVTYDRHQPFPAVPQPAPPRASRGVTLDLRWTGTDVQLPYVEET
ncbi:MAG: transglutaminase family protein [Alphaproteobacteria bacterium]|nr:transglutaminase family protein [Alphaproteobacteria bacterium]